MVVRRAVKTRHNHTAFVGGLSTPLSSEVSKVLSADLLSILACPACKAKVVLEESLLVCTNCGRRYPIRDGIPIMLIEEGDRLRIEPPPSSQPGRDG